MMTTTYRDYVLSAVQHSLTDNPGLTPYKIALECGLDPSLFAKALRGERQFTERMLDLLIEAKSLNINPIEAKALKIRVENPPEAVALAAKQLDYTGKPELLLPVACKGVVAAGEFTQVAETEDLTYYQWMDPSVVAEDMFCLKIVGHSMAPVFLDGGLLLVRPTQHLKPNGYYVIETSDGEATFKLAKFNSFQAKLEPLNPDYQPVEIGNRSIQQLYQVLEYKLTFR